NPSLLVSCSCGPFVRVPDGHRPPATGQRSRPTVTPCVRVVVAPSAFLDRVRGAAEAMMPMPKYFSLSFKQRMVERMTGPQAVSATRLGREVGVSQDSLSRWLREASSLGDMAKPGARGPRQWTLDEKIRVLAAARGLSGNELTTLL